MQWKRYSQEEMLGALESLKEKLHPSGFTAMSGKMAAIVAYIVGEVWTDPFFAEIVVTSDGMVLGRQAGGVGHNEFIGADSDLRRNWSTLLGVAGLTPDELELAEQLYEMKVVSAGEVFD